MASRIAISGLTPARPLRIPESVLRLTRSALAAADTERPSGSRHSSRMISPGCGGLCMQTLLSVIVDVIHVDGIVALEAEHDAPVAADVHCPGALQPTLQRMKALVPPPPDQGRV